MVIAIVGPTGSGKTKLSIELAKRLNGEIINADSMQFYKGLNIGTAKVKEEEQENIVHHLFDILDINTDYSIYEYQKNARIVLDDILNRKKIPIVVGGTGLYIKALLYDYKLEEKKIDNNYDDMDTIDIYNKLISLDKNVKVDKNNRKRIIRALNYYLENNKSISDNKTNTLLYDTIFIGLDVDRNILYDRINKRVDKMIDDGLLNEVKTFYKSNKYSKPLLTGIGYKEVIKYLDNEISYEDMIDLIKKNSRHYAKRQYTFFKNQMNVKWFLVDYNNFDKLVDEVDNYVNNMY